MSTFSHWTSNKITKVINDSQKDNTKEHVHNSMLKLRYVHFLNLINKNKNSVSAYSYTSDNAMHFSRCRSPSLAPCPVAKECSKTVPSSVPTYFTETLQRMSSDTDSYLLQEDLDNIERCCQKWLLKLHPEKCKVMHVGHSYQTTYSMENSGSPKILQQTEEEKDLGVFITSDLKSSTQCNKAANKAMSVLRMVNRAFRRLDNDDFLIIYKSFIRPHLEYCVQSWNTHYLKDEEVLEKVQKRATKCVKGLKGKTYSEKLHILGLTTLKRRRIRGDLIKTFKILSGKEYVDIDTFSSQRTSVDTQEVIVWSYTRSIADLIPGSFSFPRELSTAGTPCRNTL